MRINNSQNAAHAGYFCLRYTIYMERKNAIIILSSVILASIAVICIVILYTSGSAQAPTTPTYQDIDLEKNERYVTYSIADLGIIFEYPTTWQTIKTEVTEVPNDSRYQKMATVYADDIPIIAAVTHGVVPDEEYWWGDIAADAASLNAITSWCDTRELRTATYHQPDEVCKILSNQQGLVFANLSGDTTYNDQITADVETFIVHHNASPYYGIALSTQSLVESGVDPIEAKRMILELALSMKFTD